MELVKASEPDTELINFERYQPAKKKPPQKNRSSYLKAGLHPSHGHDLGMKSLTWTRKPYFANYATDWPTQQTQTLLTYFTIYAGIMSNSMKRVYG